MNLKIWVAATLLVLPRPGRAQQPPPPVVKESIEVTATRIAEDVSVVPASVTIIDGEDLRARGAEDLTAALGTAAGVSVAPGGDAGPAGSVPELWGLREFDAFLLVVDGVPWGGAFNPDLATIDLTDVDRIEIVRGAAPVIYGATSFVGIIHVIHRPAGSGWTTGRVAGGSYGSFAASGALPLSSSNSLSQSLVVSGERRGFRADRSGFDRGHLLYRASHQLGAASLRFDLDGSVVNQQPYSPHPREGRQLSASVPLDANHNPRGAKIDERRVHTVLGLDAPLAGGEWQTTLAVTRSDFNILRGFLSEVAEGPQNAAGFTQDRAVTDIYFDAHFSRRFRSVRTILGADLLHGSATAESGLFDYTIDLAGRNPPAAPPPDEETRISDSRAFASAYGVAEWTPLAPLRFDAGLRLNHTNERRRATSEEESGRDERSTTRVSGTAGVTWQLWTHAQDSASVFADYRNAFKPAAIDFGPEAEGDILEPENSRSWEAGARGRIGGGRLRWQTSAFDMDFENLVVSTVVDGRPALENAGSERFRGAELELDYAIRSALRWELGYSYHDARFRDYVRAFDGVPTQLAGKRLEMSPFHLLGTALTWSPTRGLGGSIGLNYVGDRYLDKRNRALAGAYTMWSAGVSYRLDAGELRLDGSNLGDVRPPVAESELGDAQYYRFPSRRVELSYRVTR